MRMAILAALISILTVGCATKLNRLTIFYQETDPKFTNLKGEECIQSGLVILADTKEMRISYSNCDVTFVRKLKDYELPQWGFPQPSKQGMH